MTTSRRSFVFALLVLVVTSACGKSSMSPTPPPVNGLTVVLQTDANHSVVGVTVSLLSDGAVVQQVSADNIGRVTFAVPQGQYSVGVNSFGFVPVSQDVSFSQPAQTVNLSLSPKNEIRIMSIALPVGVTASNIKCGQNVIVHLEYAVSQAYPTIPDGPLSVTAIISDDGVKTSSGSGTYARSFYGKVSLSFGITNCDSPFTTNYIIGLLEQTGPGRPGGGIQTVHAADSVPYPLVWQPGP